MARFDVYANTGPHLTHIPYLLDVQSDWLQGLDTRAVVPLRLLKTPVASLATGQARIVAALDFLTVGCPSFTRGQCPISVVTKALGITTRCAMSGVFSSRLSPLTSTKSVRMASKFHKN